MMSETRLWRFSRIVLPLLLLLAGQARAQEMPYPAGLPPEDLEDPGVGLSLSVTPSNPAAPPFQATTRLSAAALNAALAAPTILGGSINGVPIGAGTAHTGRFTNLTVMGELATTTSNAWAVGDGTVRKPFTHTSYLSPDSGVMRPLFLVQGNAFGTITSNATTSNLRAFNVNADTANANAAQGGGLNANYFGHTVSPGSVGGRTTLNVFLNHAGSTQGTGNRFHVAMAGFAHASGTAGGTAGNGNAKGHLFGANFSSLLATSAGQYWEQAVSAEFNVGARTGTSVNEKIGIQVVQWATDAVAASRTESGLLFVSQPSITVPGWSKMVQAGAFHGVWPVRPTGSLFALDEANPEFVQVPMVAANGIDFATVPAKFTAAAFASPGFRVDGAGQMVLGSNTIGWSSAGLNLGAVGKVGAVSSIAAGGTGHQAGAIVRDTHGGVYEIATVSSGAITGLTVIKAPTITSGSAPSNPRALSGGKGGGATVNLAWTDAKTITATGDLALVGQFNGGGTTKTTRLTYNDSAATAELQIINDLGGGNSIAVKNTNTNGYSAYVARDAAGIERMAIGVGNSGTPQNDVVYWEASYFTGSPHSTPPPTIKIQQTGYMFGGYGQRNRQLFLPDGRIQLMKADGNAGFVFNSDDSSLALKSPLSAAVSGATLDVFGPLLLGDAQSARGNALTGSPAIGINQTDGAFLRMVRPSIGTAQIVMSGTNTSDRALDLVNTDNSGLVMARFALNGTGNVTFAGQVTATAVTMTTGRLRHGFATLAGAGNTQAGATLLTASFVRATAADAGNTAFRLPPAVAGEMIRVLVASAAGAEIFPASGESLIDGLSGDLGADEGFAFARGDEVLLRCVENGKWLMTKQAFAL